MFEQENVDSRRVATVGIFGAVIVFVAILAIQVLFYRLEKADQRVKGRGKPREVAVFDTKQQAALNEYRWTDKEQKWVAIPIKQAMALTVEELARSHP